MRDPDLARARARKYATSEHGREMRRLWRKSDAGLAYQRQQNVSAPGIARRRRFEATDRRRSYKAAWARAYRARTYEPRRPERWAREEVIARRARAMLSTGFYHQTEVALYFGIGYASLRRILKGRGDRQCPSSPTAPP